jgi:hypothetical protein
MEMEVYSYGYSFTGKLDDCVNPLLDGFLHDTDAISHAISQIPFDEIAAILFIDNTK